MISVLQYIEILYFFLVSLVARPLKPTKPIMKAHDKQMCFLLTLYFIFDIFNLYDREVKHDKVR